MQKAAAGRAAVTASDEQPQEAHIASGNIDDRLQAGPEMYSDLSQVKESSTVASMHVQMQGVQKSGHM